MSGPKIEAPFTIASLPKPFDNDHGRVWATPVYSLREARKRKRHEIAVGVDGESVNIYNVQGQSLITSYALPPQTYLRCPPCSVYCRSTTQSPAQRRTYLVTTDGSSNKRRVLVSFVENVRQRGRHEADPVAPVRQELKLPEGDPVNIDLVPSPADEQPAVLVTYKNGATFLISPDTSNLSLSDVTATRSTGDGEVEFATTLDAVTARKSILKSRNDVTALWDYDGSPVTNPALACRIVRLHGQRRLCLYTIPNPRHSLARNTMPVVQLVMSYDLPVQRTATAGAAMYELHAPSGRLYQLLLNRLSIFDLTETIPRCVTTLGGKMSSMTSFARVSASSALALAEDAATLYETVYGSVQASLPLNSSIHQETRIMKQMRGQTGQSVLFQAVSVFTDLGLLVALSGRELVAMQLDGVSRSSSGGSVAQATLLAEVMGKGSTRETYNLEKAERRAKSWSDWTAKVDSLIEDGDVAGLETLVAYDPTLGNQRSNITSNDIQKPNGIVNGHLESNIEMWPQMDPVDLTNVDRDKVAYLLTKVFARGEGEKGRLYVRFKSERLLEWLALGGFLTASSIRKVLPERSGHEESSLPPGDVMNFVRTIDDDFRLMATLLSLPTYWDPEEVLQALRILFESFDIPSIGEAPLRLLAPPQPNPDTDEDDADSHLASAEHELDNALTALNTGLEVRSDILFVIISRLHSFPSSTVTSKMRTMMSQRELAFFIHVLRIELREGGWTSYYVDARDEEGEEQAMVNGTDGFEEADRASDQALKAIGDLLNCAVDAIGTSGWLVGLSSDAVATEDLLSGLTAEVSAGLECCYEATALQTLLVELEQCAASIKKVSDRGEKRKWADGDDLNEEEMMLPLGGRVEPPAMKVRPGKSSKKTKLALAREKSRKVGQYSFERIRI